MRLRSNGSQAGNDFVALWNRTWAEAEEKKAAWIDEMKAQYHVTAIHPDDGWVNRELDRVHFCYPDFIAAPKTGDRIVLGWPDRWRLVEIDGYRDVGPIGPMRWWYFHETGIASE